MTTRPRTFKVAGLKAFGVMPTKRQLRALATAAEIAAGIGGRAAGSHVTRVTPSKKSYQRRPKHRSVTA